MSGVVRPVERFLAWLGLHLPEAEARRKAPDKVGPPVRTVEWWASMADLAGQTTSFPCDLGPDGVVWTCVRDTSADSTGWPRHVDEHGPSASTDVMCSGLASIWDHTYDRGPEADLLVCTAHDRWLRDHGWIDGSNSGTNMRRVDGTWVTTRASAYPPGR